MKFYKIPFDIKHEEKIFGGYLSLRQVLYLSLTGLSGSIFLFRIAKYIKIFVFIILASIFVSFAFIKINETRLDIYVINIIKFFFRRKKFEFVR